MIPIFNIISYNCGLISSYRYDCFHMSNKGSRLTHTQQGHLSQFLGCGRCLGQLRCRYPSCPHLKHGPMACCRRRNVLGFCVVPSAPSLQLSLLLWCTWALLLLMVMSRWAHSTVFSSFLVSPIAHNWLLTESGNPTKNWCNTSCSRAFASRFGIAS